MAQPANPSTLKTFVVALILSGVCSVLVTASVTLLKARQEINMLVFKRANVLKAAGFEVPTAEVNELFERRIELRYFELESGDYVAAPADPQFDSVAAAKDPAYILTIAPSEDLARIKRRAKISEVYFLKPPKAELDAADPSHATGMKIILPVRGKGLWSTMQGFMAVDPHTFDILGLSFYAHAETPGLGGEIDNPKWLAQWSNKKIYNDQGEIALKVLRGVVPSDDPQQDYHVDGLAGATLTSNGVTNMVLYWFGSGGYQTFLTKQRRAGWQL